MEQTRNRVFRAGLLVLLLAGHPAVAGAGLLTDVQYWLAPDHIQTVIFFDAPVTPAYHHRANPARFVVEIPSCEALWGDQRIPVDDPMLERIRVQRLSNGTLQIVFDVTEKLEAAVQNFPKSNGQPHRIVVTLYDPHAQHPAPPPAPVLQATEAAPPQHVPEVPAAPSVPAAIDIPSVVAAPVAVTAAPQTPPAAQQRPYIVVLDPGHGGRDPGATSRGGLKEKDIVLDLALKMRAMIQEHAPHIQVYLTRDTDIFLSLPKRTEIAEQHRADLFVSLHVNANPSRKVQGFSVYTLSENASDAAAHALAEKENAVDLIFGVETPLPQKDSMLTFILADLSKTSWLQHSLEFGNLVVDTTVAALKAHKVAREGVKRANFAVLRTAAMPAVLVEACYLSNDREEELLKRQDFRLALAQALASGTMAYFAQRPSSGRTQVAQLSPTIAASSATLQAGAPARVHVVRSGESLSVIAGKYKVAVAQLRQVNNLASADLIYAGQQLWIP